MLLAKGTEYIDCLQTNYGSILPQTTPNSKRFLSNTASSAIMNYGLVCPSPAAGTASSTSHSLDLEGRLL